MSEALVDEGRASEIAVFGGLRGDALQTLLNGASVRRLPDGASLFERGSLPGEFYVVLSGRLAVVREDGGVERYVEVNGSVGLLSMIDFQPRALAAVAVGTTTVLGISATGLDQLYRRDPRAYSLLVLNLARELARMLRSYVGA